MICTVFINFNYVSDDGKYWEVLFSCNIEINKFTCDWIIVLVNIPKWIMWIKEVKLECKGKIGLWILILQVSQYVV